MSYLKTLRERRKTPVAAWHKLRTSLATSKFDFYVAFEGEEDEEFYSDFISDRFPGKKFRPIICDGKGGVLALHGEVTRAYGSPRNVFFFIDADHDRFLGADEYPAQTFSTCGYAIENYIYDTEVVLAGIKKHFQLNVADDLCAAIRTAFENDRVTFEARARALMSYVVALRSSDQSPDLDKVGLNEIFEFKDEGLVTRKLDCAALLAATNVEPLLLRVVIEHARNYRGIDANVIVRGKLVAQFIVNFCRRLARRFKNTPKLNGKSLKSKIDFGKKNLVSTFVEFVAEPSRLSDFFEEMDQVLGPGRGLRASRSASRTYGP